MKLESRVGVLLAAMAMALMAFGGTAQAAHFASKAEHTNVSGSQDNTHIFSNGTIEFTCSTAHFTGSQSGETFETITITPEYSGCHAIMLFTFAVTVDVNSCDYVVNANGDVNIACDEEGEAIVVSFAGCTMEFGEQTIEGAVSFENSGGNVVVTAIATGIKYTQYGGICGSGEGANASYIGQTTVSGEDAATEEPVNISWTG